MRIAFEVSDEHDFPPQRELAKAFRQSGIAVAFTTTDFRLQDRISAFLDRQGLCGQFVPHARMSDAVWDVVVATGRRGDTPYRNQPIRALLSVSGVDPRTGQHREAEIIREDRYQAYLAASQADVDACLKESPSLFEGRHVHIVGRPWYDALRQGQFNRKAVLGRLRLPADHPTLLFVSGGRDHSLFHARPEVIEFMKGIQDVNVIASARPNLWGRRLPPGLSRGIPNAGKRQRPGYWRWLTHHLRKTDHVVRRCHDFHQVMAVSDMLISDDIDLARACFVLNRPVLLFDACDSKDGIADAGFQKAVRTFARVEQLPDLIRETLRDPSALERQRSEWLDRWIEYLGQSAERTVEVILSLATVPRHEAIRL